MTIVGLIGIMIGLLAWPFAFIDRSRTRITVFVLTFGMPGGRGAARERTSL